jgi:hypothetical protein
MSLNSDYKRIAARSRSKKVIYYEDTQQWQYYDLETDPLEKHNLVSEQKEPRLQEVVNKRQNKIESMPSTNNNGVINPISLKTNWKILDTKCEQLNPGF